jgi:hypothetical protein
MTLSKHHPPTPDDPIEPPPDEDPEFSEVEAPPLEPTDVSEVEALVYAERPEPRRTR